LTHIKGARAALRNRGGVATLAQLLDQALRAARDAQWSECLQRVGALRAALAEQREPREDELRARLDMLNAAAPQHDPDGYRQELGQVGLLLQQSALRDREAPLGESALDLRGLEPPEPILRIFDALERGPGTPLRVILPHEPVPLYGLLRERGLRYSGAPRADGGYELLIDRF
jgi:hypothetical protein